MTADRLLGKPGSGTQRHRAPHYPRDNGKGNRRLQVQRARRYRRASRSRAALSLTPLNQTTYMPHRYSPGSGSVGAVSARFVRALVCGLAVGLAMTSPSAAATPTAGLDRLKDNLYGTKFVDPDHGWVVGAFGSVFRSDDGGQTWTPQASKTTESLYDVDFIDTQRGWAVGRSGTILHTEDGGKNWEAQASGVDKHLFSVDFVDARHGVVAGDWGAILVTDDGGRTWENHALQDDVILNDVSMTDASHGWIAGEMGTILHTEDGGRSWTPQTTGVDKSLFGVYFADAQHGWAVGIDALILRTDDGGQTWRVQNGSTEIRELEMVGFSSAYENPSLYAVQVVGDLGIAVGEIGAVYTSSDGGRTWARRPGDAAGGPKWFRALSLVPGTHGVIVGAGGERLRVVDGKVESPSGGTRASETLH
ncbi:MAG: YCF48-related protein [Candidatus Binatia bacterium]